MHASRPVVGLLAVLATGTLIAGAVAANPPTGHAQTVQSLTINPTCGDGHTTTFTASGDFTNASGVPADGDAVDIYFDGVRERQNVALDSHGHLNPTSVATTPEPADGPHQVTTVVITSVDEPGSTNPGPSATYLVPCAPPTLLDNPAAVAFDPTGYSVQLSGDNWGFDSAIALTFDGRGIGSAGADSDGTFGTTVPVSADCGNHQFGASTTIGTGSRTRVRSASVVFTVVFCTSSSAPPPPPGPGSPSAPRLTLTPAVVPTGFVTTAHGSSYTAGSPVTFRWLLADHRSVPASCAVTVVGAGGSFDAPCLVLPHDQLGSRQLVAAQAAGGSASARCLVVANGFEPDLEGELVGRR